MPMKIIFLSQVTCCPDGTWLPEADPQARCHGADLRLLLGDSIALNPKKNKMKPTNPNAHTYVNGTDVKTHGFAVTHNIFLQ